MRGKLWKGIEDGRGKGARRIGGPDIKMQDLVLRLRISAVTLSSGGNGQPKKSF